MMQTCSNGHPPIQHDEFYCPLCCEIEDYAHTQDLLSFADDTIIDLRNHIDDLDLADVLHAQASEAEANRRAYGAETKYRELRYALDSAFHLRGPMGKRLERIGELVDGRRRATA